METFLRLMNGGAGNLAAYLAAHVLLCLLPAFFIAGAMAALIPKASITRWLGRNARYRVSYPAAAAAGSLLAVCSCTIVPLFAGIYKKGAGLGPAITFLFFAPAGNVLALAYTGSILGAEFAFARFALSLLFGVALIVLLRLVSVPWQILATVAAIAVLGALGFWFWRSLTLLDVATPALGQGLVFLAFLAGNSAQDRTQKQQLKRELEERKLALAKAEGEMEAGRRIQMGMLPGAASVAGDKRFDLGALMVPARQIGGDLYDFFKIDERRLFFAVGDVSGKGVPAALFMALGKSLCRSYALRGRNDVGTIINLANAEIARDNPEMLFITMFAGILDLGTGEVQFCNAGHDAPYILRKARVPEPVVAAGGPPLCVVDDFVYATERLTLKPGDMLCVTTDGVAEAMNASGALLGAERTKQILAAIPADANATDVVDELYKAVGRFVDGAEASDDLTVLTVRWNGP
jgi:serine phosphatase RsbU (regulator of sigma subunit)